MYTSYHPEATNAPIAAAALGPSAVPPVGHAPYPTNCFATNQRFAGRSARRRMYHGNHAEP